MEKGIETLLRALNEALSIGTHTAASDRIALRDAVCAYLAAEQARGATVESVVQTVGDILGKAEGSSPEANADLAAQLIDACRGFYRTPGLRSI